MNREDFEEEGRAVATALQDGVQGVVDAIPKLDMVIAIGFMKAHPDDPVDATMIMAMCPNKGNKVISMTAVKEGIKALLAGFDEGVAGQLNAGMDVDGDKAFARKWVNRKGEETQPPPSRLNWDGGQNEDK